MKKVYQTVFTNEENTVHGNCLCACIASLLGIDINEVPEINEAGADWFRMLFKFMTEKGYEVGGTARNLQHLIDINCQGVDGLYIGCGLSPRKHVKNGHAVLIDIKGNLIHDPHPSGDGILRLDYIIIIEKLTPQKDETLYTT